jgi:cytochrome c oxidase subunit 2
MNRRAFAALLAGSAVTAAAATLRAAERPAEIRISARKFEYRPNRVTARVGQPVVLVLTSEDRIHGFKMPDFGLRTEIVPGQETRVALTPARPGSFAFLCDLFCGDGHEDMEGVLVVEA